MTIIAPAEHPLITIYYRIQYRAKSMITSVRIISISIFFFQLWKFELYIYVMEAHKRLCDYPGTLESSSIASSYRITRQPSPIVLIKENEMRSKWNFEYKKCKSFGSVYFKSSIIFFSLWFVVILILMGSRSYSHHPTPFPIIIVFVFFR